MTDKANGHATVKLAGALMIGDEAVPEITIRKPVSGDLRGIKLVQLLEMDVDTVGTVLERVTQPPLNKLTFYQLEAPDLANLSTALVGFFLDADPSRPPK